MALGKCANGSLSCQLAAVASLWPNKRGLCNAFQNRCPSIWTWHEKVGRNRFWWIFSVAKETLSFWASNCHTDATLVTNDGMCLRFSKNCVSTLLTSKTLQRDTTETLRQLHWTPCVSLVPHKNTCNVSQVYALYPALKKHGKSLDSSVILLHIILKRLAFNIVQLVQKHRIFYKLIVKSI